MKVKEKNWTPLYFLAALGAGGMAVTFFMILMFWIPHPGQPVPVVADWMAVFASGGIAMKVSTGIALVGIAFFVMLHFKLLVWNFVQYRHFKIDGGEAAILGRNAHTQLMAIPLTVAMGINTLFIVGLVFVPDIWQVVEWLFPLAVVAFLLVGIWALRIYLSFFGEALAKGSFNSAENNSLAQMLPAFALAMVGVGLAAPAAMSQNPTMVGLASVLSLFFVVAAVLLGAIKLILGLGRLFDHGAKLATLPTLWIAIPILTVVGIAMVRLQHGFHTLHMSEGKPFLLVTVLFVLQILFVMLGWSVMRRMDYFGKMLRGEIHSPAAFSLVCPGVALVVMGHFFVNKGLVALQVIDKFDPLWMVLVGGLVLVQIATGWLLLTLNRNIRPHPELPGANATFA